MEKTTTNITKKSYFIFISLLILFTLCSCKADARTQTVDDYFSALKELDFVKAGSLLGDEEAYNEAIESLNDPLSYLSYETSRNYLSFIYGGITYEVTDKDNDILFLSISAYNTDEVMELLEKETMSFTSSQDYLSGSVGQRYVMLCDFQSDVYSLISPKLTKYNSQVRISVTKTGQGEFIIKSDKSFFDALAGISTQNADY